MKVLHLIDSGGLYGAEKMLLTLVAEQIKQGLEPMILSAGEPGIGEKAIEAEAKRLGLPVTPWRMKPGLNLKEMRRIIQWSKDQGYDLMHSHGYKFNILAGIWPRKWRRVPLVTTLHGYVHAPRFTKMWVYELLDRLILPRMNAVILVSHSMREELATIMRHAQNLRVVPNGMDIQEVQDSSEQSLSAELQEFLNGHNPVVLGVGRLAPEKGFDTLIESISQLNGSYPDIGLIIVGEGKLRGHLQALAGERGIADKVMMPGFYDQIPALMRHSDVLAMPSKTEGLPMTALEAMAVGTPIVATRVGALPAVLEEGEGGWFVDGSSSNAVSMSLKDCLEDPEKTQSKIGWAKDKAIQSFSSEAMEKAYRDIYQKVFAL